MLAKKIIITTFISFFGFSLLTGMETKHAHYFPKQLQGPFLILMDAKSDKSEFGLPYDTAKKEIVQRNCDLYAQEWDKNWTAVNEGERKCYFCFDQKKIYDKQQSNLTIKLTNFKCCEYMGDDFFKRLNKFLIS